MSENSPYHVLISTGRGTQTQETEVVLDLPGLGYQITIDGRGGLTITPHGSIVSLWHDTLPRLHDLIDRTRSDDKITLDEQLQESGHLMTVEWHEEDRTYTLGARADKSDEWVTMLFEEEEVDTMLGMGRDIMTGG